MLLDRLDEDLDAGYRDLSQLDRQRRALFGGYPTRPTVGDVPLGVQRAEVAADGHVVGPQLEPHSSGL